MLAAKVGVFGLVGLMAGQASGFAAFLVDQIVLGAAGAPTASLGQPSVLRAVIGLIGVAIGCLIRTTMAATTALVIHTFTIPIIAPRLLPDAAASWIHTYWPISAGLQITTTIQDPALLPPWVGVRRTGGLHSCDARRCVRRISGTGRLNERRSPTARRRHKGQTRGGSNMAMFITIGYGDRAGYERTEASVRDAPHDHDA